jgi:hypothetical protein
MVFIDSSFCRAAWGGRPRDRLSDTVAAEVRFVEQVPIRQDGFTTIDVAGDRLACELLQEFHRLDRPGHPRGCPG